MTQQQGLTQPVEFRREISWDEIPPYFAVAEIIALGSATEASDDVLYAHDGVTGLIVPPANTSAMIVAIGQLLFDEKRRKCLGDQARKMTGSTFSCDTMIDRVVNTYEQFSWRRALRHTLIIL